MRRACGRRVRVGGGMRVENAYKAARDAAMLQQCEGVFAVTLRGMLYASRIEQR